MDEPGFMQFRSPRTPSVQIIVGSERGVGLAPGDNQPPLRAGEVRGDGLDFLSP